MPWQVVALSITGLMLFASVIAYGLGKIARRPRIISAAEDEVARSIENLILIGAFTTIILILDLLLVQITGINAYEIAANYLSDLQVKLLTMEAVMLVSKIALDLIASIEIDFIVVGFQPLAGLAAVGSVLGMLIKMGVIIMGAVLVQMVILNFVRLTATNILLPVGLVLRSFRFTRAGGAYLMAVSMALYVGLPLLLAFNQYTIQGFIETNIEEKLEPFVQLQDEIQSHMGDGASLQQIVFHRLSLINVDMMKGIMTALTSIENWFASLILAIIILPVVDFILLSLFTRALARALGSTFAPTLNVFRMT